MMTQRFFTTQLLLAAVIALTACSTSVDAPIPTLLDEADAVAMPDGLTATDAVLADGSTDATAGDAVADTPDVSVDTTPDAPVPVCAPASTWCDGATAKKCDASGLIATVVADCSLPGSLGLPQVCVGGTCLTASCPPGQKACVNASTLAECFDGIGWKAVSCDDGSPCTLDGCQGAACQSVQINDVPCDDGTACTQTDKCFGGKCLGGNPLQCDDQNACTTDACDPVIGCTHVALTGLSCLEDGNACTHDACEAGVCAHPPVLNGSACADDGQPCTLDSCDNGTCTHPPKDGPLCPDDGLPCTIDICQGGQCAHVKGAGPCQDGNECTQGDQCVNGQCAPGQPRNCDDGNACTQDSCDPSVGCLHGDINGAPCPSGSGVCPAGSCWSGKCLPTANAPCQMTIAIGACPPQTLTGLCTSSGQCAPQATGGNESCGKKPCAGICLKCGPYEVCYKI
jgi:hypothetical protein